MIAPLNNQENKPIDWWFIYKLPMNTGPKKDTTGFEFLYCDSTSKQGLSLSPVSLDHEQSALALTLNQIFSGEPDVGYVLWNDEIPPTASVIKPKNNEGKGHSKGVLAFSKKNNCGFYLLHSTPRFPAEGIVELPEDEKRFGQTYICFSLKDYAEANKLASVLLLQNEAQVYAKHLPEVGTEEAIFKLANNNKFETPVAPSILNLKTISGFEFTHIAKNKHWSEPVKPATIGKDFWKDLVGPSLKCNLDVETWRRGLVFGDIDPDKKENTKDDVDIDLTIIGLPGYNWAYTKDHAKWGISVKIEESHIIVSDLNRQLSQCKRGGGAVVFNHPGLWKSLDAIQVTEKNLETNPHIDKS
ncbi:deoxyribonuclease-2 [Gillisia sp. Hel_I_86]|uniref:deoxyribonuclease II family protein n=1 Tax=Gillisia sp. Hel_I_86 TaxID=1249981 RepID=UPI00119C5B02|nr:deoxyribonuclease II family protein [Gillisia sp. Hel_I_86]TVZ28324.1 deoxyribonuclease-2 [Gillisia sp. Hel_I_86]